MEQTTATLLLVDDEAMNRDALSRRLARRGYTVLTAESGPAALEMIGANRVDAVLLDVMMPGMSGLDVLRRVRHRHDPTDLPVIMATAKMGRLEVAEALARGASDYMVKPINTKVLVQKLAKLVAPPAEAKAPPAKASEDNASEVKAAG